MGPTRNANSTGRLRAVFARQVRESNMARQTSWALVAELVRMVTQLAMFLIVTHLFTAGDYGVYVGTIGLLAFVFPFATVGASYVLLRRVAGEGMEPGRALGHATTTVILGGLVTAPLLVLLRPWILPQASIAVLATSAATELIFAGVQDLAVFVAQATHQLHVSVPLRLAAGISRLVAVLILWGTVASPTLAQLTLANLLAAAFATGASINLLRRQGISFGRLPRPRTLDLRQGLPFSVGFGADKLRESADSVLLLRLDRPVDAGIYGAASRLVDMAVVPLRSLSHASNARFFEAGRESVRVGRRTAVRVTSVALAYAIPTAVVMALLGPTVINLLPGSYQSAAQAVRVLALWPIAVSIEMFAGTALTAVGHHRTRVVTNLLSAALNVALNLLWIPDHGWRGSVAATLTTSFLSSLVMWASLVVYGRREPRPQPHQRADASPIARR